MCKKLFIPILFLLFFSAKSVFAEESTFLNHERIGDFHLGMSGHEARKKVTCLLKQHEDVLWGADGLYHQVWDCYEGGISLNMASSQKGGHKTVSSITITAPNKLRTARGIQIGDTEQAVIQAYQNEKDAEATEPGESFVAGSIYGGLMFQFKHGVVDSIFLGAGAE